MVLGGPILSLLARLILLATSAAVALILRNAACSGNEACFRCTLEWAPRVCVGCGRDAHSVDHIIYGPEAVALCETCTENTVNQLSLVKTELQTEPEPEPDDTSGTCTFRGRIDVPRWELITWPTATMCGSCAEYYNVLLNSEKAAAG